MFRFVSTLLLATFSLTACANNDILDTTGPVPTDVAAEQSTGLLGFVNDPDTGLATLDDTCRLRSDAAFNVIAHRDGPDGILGTADDDLFDSVEELEAVDMIGRLTVDRLFACAAGLGYIFEDPAGLMEFINDQQVVTQELLDDQCKLRSDAARNIAAHRDGEDGLIGTDDDNLFDDLVELEAVSQVGQATLDDLYTCAVQQGYTVVPEQVETHNELAELPDELAEVVDGALAERAALLANPESDYGVEFVEAAIYQADGVVVRYEITFVQTIDPKLELMWWIVFTLDDEMKLIAVSSHL